MRNDHGSKRTGATIVEAAAVISILVMFIFGIFDYGRFVFTKQLMENAAREGARWAVVNTYTATTNDVRVEVERKLGIGRNQLVGYNRNTNIRIFAADASGNPIGGKSWTDAGFGESIGVEIIGTYRPSVPNLLFMDASFPISSRSVMASEAN